jgi:hypothetical protein
MFLLYKTRFICHPFRFLEYREIERTGHLLSIQAHEFFSSLLESTNWLKQFPELPNWFLQIDYNELIIKVNPHLVNVKYRVGLFPIVFRR